MFKTDKFQRWVRLEMQRRLGILDLIDREVEKQMRRIKVEIKQDGRWVEVGKDQPLMSSAP
jgi:hypothetical protein